MNIGTAIAKIRACGFQIHAEGDHISVEPFDRLTAGQLGWLRANKPAILDHLLIDDQGGNDIAPANDQGNPITVEAFTPLGGRMLVRANSAEHAAWIQHMNPRPGMVRCCDCTHATITNGIASCGAGVESGLPIRGRWYSDRHACDSYQATA